MNKSKAMLLASVMVVFLSTASAIEGYNGSDDQPHIMDSPNVESDVGAVPGDLMYGFKRVSEQVNIIAAGAPIIGSDEAEEKARLDAAQKRVLEASKIAETQPERAQNLMQNQQRHVNQVMEIANRSDNEKMVENASIANQNAVSVLKEVKDNAPEEAQIGLDNAISSVEKRGEQIAAQMQEIDERSENKQDPSSQQTPQDTSSSENKGDFPWN